MDGFDLDAYIEEGVAARKAIDSNQVRGFAELLYGKLTKGGKLIVFGNGGSAADAQHFAAELTGHFAMERKPFPAMALNTNTSALTAIGNDYSYDTIFERQVSAFAVPGDVVVGISTSGNSPNVLNGLNAAIAGGSYAFGMTGKSGGKMSGLGIDLFRAYSDSTPVIQEVHITFIHMVCLEFDRLLGNDGRSR